MELMAPHVVRLYKCPAAGVVVDVSVDIEPIDRLVGGLGALYCRVFLQFTVVPFVLELSVGFGHVVHASCTEISKVKMSSTRQQYHGSLNNMAVDSD